MPNERVQVARERLRKLIGHPTRPATIWHLVRRRTSTGTEFVSFFVCESSIPTSIHCIDLQVHAALGVPIAKDQRGLKVTGEVGDLVRQIIDALEPEQLRKQREVFETVHWVYDNHRSID